MTSLSPSPTSTDRSRLMVSSGWVQAVALVVLFGWWAIRGLRSAEAAGG